MQIIHATLYKALKQAVKWTLLPGNVADPVDPPKAPKREIKPLNEEQVKRLLKAADGDKLEALCTCWPSPRECVRVSFWGFNGKTWICQPG